MPSPDPAARRPLKSRQSPLFQRFATALARSGITPNAISFASIVFAGAAAVALWFTSHTGGWQARIDWLAAAICIQLRLLANMLDGMVAVEGGKGGPTGDLWNEAPDRISDSLILIGAGFAAGSAPWLGYVAALVAMFVAYVRALGASVGAGQLFLGPMAKPHRMFAMTVLCVAAAIMPGVVLPVLALRQAPPHAFHHGSSMLAGPVIFPLSATSIALLLIIAGGAVTAYRRLMRIAQFLRTRSVQ
jgi:phosphatidylglycerophosphate synthase